MSNAISGTGGFVQSGSGTTILSGASTYTGATAVNSGTLNLAATASLTNTAIVNAATFTETAGATITGPRRSRTTQGLQPFPARIIHTPGPTTVNGGQLNLSGTLASSAVTVGSGASAILLVSGNSTIGSVGLASVTLTANTGTLSLVDGSINTLTIGGGNSTLTLNGNDNINLEVSSTTSD